MFYVFPDPNDPSEASGNDDGYRGEALGCNCGSVGPVFCNSF